MEIAKFAQLPPAPPFNFTAAAPIWTERNSTVQGGQSDRLRYAQGVGEWPTQSANVGYRYRATAGFVACTPLPVFTLGLVLFVIKRRDNANPSSDRPVHVNSLGLKP
jgi:hypothetical protein